MVAMQYRDTEFNSLMLSNCKMGNEKKAEDQQLGEIVTLLRAF